MSGAVWAMLLTLSVLWGGSFLFVEIAVEEVPPLTLVLVRVALAALALWTVVAATGRAVPCRPGIWLAFAGMGLLNNAIPFALIAWGQTGIGSGLASILNATTPIFGVLVAHALTADERLSPLKAAGVAAGFAGVATMIGWDALGGIGQGVAAQLACLGAALSYAFASVFGRRFRAMGIDPVMTATGQVSASSLLILPFALALDRPWTLAMPSAGAAASLVLLALASTALAYILYFRILAAAGAVNVVLVTFLVPPSAILMGWAVLGERLGPAEIAGLALIALGLALIDGRAVRWLAARRARAG